LIILKFVEIMRNALFVGEITTESAFFVASLKNLFLNGNETPRRRGGELSFLTDLFFDREAERFRFRFLNDFQLDSGFGRRFRFRRVEVF